MTHIDDRRREPQGRNKYLRMYRDTQHPSLWVPPTELLFRCSVKKPKKLKDKAVKKYDWKLSGSWNLIGQDNHVQCFPFCLYSWIPNKFAAGKTSCAGIKKFLFGVGHMIKSIFLCFQWQLIHTASDRSCESLTRLLYSNNARHWRLHWHANTDQNSIS